MGPDAGGAGLEGWNSSGGSTRPGAVEEAVSCVEYPKTEQILDDPEAMRLFKREYRKPWVVPEDV